MTKLIPILSGRCLVVELPEGAPKPYVINTGQPHLSCLDIDVDFPEIDLPPGNWRIIGMLSEVMEKQAAGLVKSIIRLGFFSGNLFKDYESDGFTKETALESLDSAILAEGYLLESPPTPKCGCFGPSEEGACPGCDEWVESQSRTLCRERCLLLGRESKTPEFMGFKIERE